MDYQDVEAFLEIAKTHNITKAAENLFLSQSSVSHRLKKLEEEFNAPLVTRQRGVRTLEFTPRGESFIPLAKQWMDLYREVEHCMTGPEVALSIGTIDSVAPGFLYPLLHRIIRERSGMCLHLSQMSSLESYRAMEDQQIDIGFVGFRYHRPYIQVRPVLQQDLCVLSRDPNLPDRPLHPSELDSAMEIYSDWGPEYHVWHERWWKAGAFPGIVTDSMAHIQTLMNEDNYWAIVPLNLAENLSENTDFRLFKLTDPPPKRICYMITQQFPKAGHKQAVEIFESFLAHAESKHAQLLFGKDLPEKDVQP